MARRPRHHTALATAMTKRGCVATATAASPAGASATSTATVQVAAWRAPTLLPGPDTPPSSTTFPDEEIPRA